MARRITSPSTVTGTIRSSWPAAGHARRSAPARRAARKVRGEGMALLLILQLHILVGGEGVHGYRVDVVLGHPWAYPDEDTQVHDRREHHAVDGELLDLVQDDLPLGGIALARLLHEHLVDVGVAAV